MDTGPYQLDLEREFRADLGRHLSRKIPLVACRVTRFGRKARGVGPVAKLAILFLLLVPALSSAAELKPETLQAWDAYVHAAKMRMEKRARGQAPFLWVDEAPDLNERVRAGEVLVGPVDGDSPRMVSLGLIHDWLGAVFVPKARLDDVMGVLDDYERYKDFYRPMVVKARRIEQTPEHEKVTLLMVQKAYSVTGAVETDNEIQVARLGADRAYSLSTSVRVQEIADYGQPGERALAEDHGPGFVWRTFSITRLEQRDEGVYVEMEMIGMSRGIPMLFRWLIQPLAERLPRNLLAATLEDTRDAVSQATQVASLKTQTLVQAAASR